MDRHDWEHLINGPAVREGLKDAEVAVINIGEIGINVLKVAGYGFESFFFFGKPHHDGPEKTLGKTALPQVDRACREELAHFIAIVNGVVEAFLKIAG